MKRFFSLILAALMLFSLTASAEIASFDAQGFALDVDEIIAMSVNEPVLVNYGVIRHDPFLSLILVGYYALPKDAVKDIENRMENTGDKEEYQRLYATLSRFSGAIAYILVTDAKTPAEAGIDDPIPEGSELTEFGAAGDYHYYFLTEPLDELLAAFDTDAD